MCQARRIEASIEQGGAGAAHLDEVVKLLLRATIHEALQQVLVLASSGLPDLLFVRNAVPVVLRGRAG